MKIVSELRRAVINALLDIAPDLDPADIRDNADLRNDLDIDSVDYLNFVIKLSESLKVNIPEVDYCKLATVNSAVSYLAEHGA